MYQVSETSEAQQDQVRAYLRAVGVEDDYECAGQPCDVCGDALFSTVVDEVVIG